MAKVVRQRRVRERLMKYITLLDTLRSSLRWRNFYMLNDVDDGGADDGDDNEADQSEGKSNGDGTDLARARLEMSLQTPITIAATYLILHCMVYMH